MARDLKAVVLPSRDVESCRRLPAPPRAIIVDVSLPGAIEAIGGWKRDFAEVPVIGMIRIPDPNLWAEAESAGADLLVTGGTIHRRVPEFLHSYLPVGRHRIRVAEAKDLDGRLGFVGRVEPEGIGPIALYHVGYEIHAVADTCPHAGARLSEGELEGSVLTCPRHGSQFDVTNGERLRGPADDALETYAVATEGGIVYLEIDDPTD
jgi:3-phenylpropionate/trans-cinnamate dioxygenase ferredoxin subunit